MGATVKKLFSEKELWKKGDITISQSMVYTRLSPGYTVIFFQSGTEGTKDFKIEMATDAIVSSSFFDHYEEIYEQVEKEAAGREYRKFNL